MFQSIWWFLSQVERGVIRKDPVVIATNASGFILNIILMILKLKYDKLQQ
jgi:hypothetical protein